MINVQKMICALRDGLCHSRIAQRGIRRNIYKALARAVR